MSGTLDSAIVGATDDGADLSREACKHMVQGACLYGERCRFSHDAAVVEAQRRITPPSSKTRTKLEGPVDVPLPPLPTSRVLPMPVPTAVPVVTLQERNPRLDPSLISEAAPLLLAAPSSPARAPSSEPAFNLTLLTTSSVPAPKSNVADELKKLL